MALTLGFDVGSSSVKASLLDPASGALLASASSPEQEMSMDAPQPGWAEQHPDLWWRHIVNSARMIRESVGEGFGDVEAIGISYQMHGLVLVDKAGSVLRPAIIWCDSRAVPYGEAAFHELGEERVLRTLLNSPGNFTAAKLAWVKDNEPELYARVHKMMLPGDYLAYRMTGNLLTTASGLSEGILWNAQEGAPARYLIGHFGFDAAFLPELAPNFADHGSLRPNIAEELGLSSDVRVSYRAGDQPNNAFSLNVLSPGEVAATAGTSGVVYGVVDYPAYDLRSRVNTFVHVNHSAERPRYGILLCLNGTAILNRWMRDQITGGEMSYEAVNELAASAPIGSEGLRVLPFGNGAERTLENVDYGASWHGLNFNIHDRSHLLRAGQEGIAFALNYGVDIMKGIDMPLERIRAGHGNMFLSPIFRDAFTTLTGATVELYKTDGSEGAARGAALGAGLVGSEAEAFVGLELKQTVEPNRELEQQYTEAYGRWLATLEAVMGAG
jgi:xylulokinase